MAYDSDRWSPSDELLDRFLVEQAAPDERTAVDAWLARTPAAWHTVRMLRQLRFGTPMTDADRLGLWQRVERQCWVNGGVPEVGGWDHTGARRFGAFKRQPLRGSAWSLVAGLLAGITALIIVWKRATPPDVAHGSGAVSTYATTSGERANITLPDGSRVTLGVASRLDVPADYTTPNHTVHLSGEALFTITRHDREPFTVIAGTATVRVLGTRFVVRHYPTDTVATVAVRDGKVAVGNLVVAGSQFVEVGPHQIVRRGPADAAQFSFATGVLTLPTMPLAQAVPELDRWYAADIRLADPSFAQVPTGGTFTAGSLSNLANLLELMLDARVVRDGRVLTLYRRAK